MERTPIDTSLADLDAIQRRIDKLIQSEKTLIADLSRRSDTCWTYPDPVSISDYYLSCIQLAEQRKALCEEVTAHLKRAADGFRKLQPLIEQGRKKQEAEKDFTIAKPIQPSSRNVSFTCQRTDLSNAIKIIRDTKLRVVTIATAFAEHKIYLKTNMVEIPVACTNPIGADTTFSVPITFLKNYCKFTPETEYHFTLTGTELQINTTILTVK